MADPLLTSLCSICHVSTPRYICPRCNIRTCSLSCVKKHKAWSECSGERDATAYLPKSKLRTAAGIDHDYNFLHGIERASERAERVLIGDKGIMQTEDLRPKTVEEVRWKFVRGRKTKVVVTRAVRDNRTQGDKLLASKLKKLNTVVETLPFGMARNKENCTTVHRKSGRIHWQVEWFMLFSEPGEGGETSKTRALSKVMDDVPLDKAYQALLDGESKIQGGAPKKFARALGQHPWGLGWHSHDVLQNPETGTWITIQSASIEKWPAPETERDRFHFFLGKARTRVDLPMSVTQLKPDGCLRDILTDTRVLEFPTIYVLKEGEALPSGFKLGPKDKAPPPEEDNKRRGGEHTNELTIRAAKRRKPNSQDEVEDGEVGGNGEGANSDGHDDDSRSKTSAGPEIDDVIAEQSIDEEDEDDDTSDDDSTSSSGSDSDAESDS